MSNFEKLLDSDPKFTDFKAFLQKNDVTQRINFESVLEQLTCALHFFSLGNPEGKTVFLKVIQDLSVGLYKQEQYGWLGADAEDLSELFEILFTIRDYDLLRSVFACDEIPKSQNEKSAALKKAIRLADGRLIEFLIKQGFDWGSTDKKSLIFSLMKGIQQAGRTRNHLGWQCCAKIFSNLYQNPENDLPLIISSVNSAMRGFYFAPRTVQSNLKTIRENTFLIQFLRCQPEINMLDLDLELCLKEAALNFMRASEAKTSDFDTRIYGSLSKKPGHIQGITDLMEELLYFIDILVTGGVDVDLEHLKDELEACLAHARQTRNVCEMYAKDPASCTRLWLYSSPLKSSGPDIISLVFEFLGSFHEDDIN